MIFNRRNAAGAMAAVIMGSVQVSASADEDGKASILTQLIDEVIADGNVDNLPGLVSPDVTIAVLGVTNIDEFRDASIDGFESRSEQYETSSFEIQSIAENEEWCHALLRFEGKKTTGKMEARSVFYVARFQDGLIHQLYLG